MTEKYGFMPGTHPEHRDNPKVSSKFDKSQGRGLPAPHLKHPGEVAKESGSSHPGHTSNGHKLPTERSVGLGGSYLRHEYSPGEMGAPQLHGIGQGHVKNTRLTDGDVIKSSRRVDQGAFLAGHEPNPVHGGSDIHVKQHSTGHGHESGKSSRPQHQDNHSSRSTEPHGQLDRVRMKS
jgi:hypothetical protein